MKCTLSININKGGNKEEVTAVGALAFTSMKSESKVFNKETFSMEDGPALSLKEIIEQNGEKHILKSMTLTNGSGFSIGNLDSTISKKKVHDFIAKDLKTTAQVLSDVNHHFNVAHKISNYKSLESSQVIIEDSDFNTDLDPERNYFIIDDKLLKKIDKLAAKNNIDKDDYLKAFILSALQRGYSINAKDAMNSSIVFDAINIFKKLNKNKDVKYGSIYQAANGENTIFRTSKGDIFAKTADVTYDSEGKQDVWKLDESSLLMNNYLSEEERTTLNKFKKIPLASKAFIANNIAKSFGRIIPDLTVEILSKKEIEDKYDMSFSNKKGFIIGNRIVINLSLFSPDTMFHEFGHFYMKWLDTYDPKLKKKILEQVKQQYPAELEHFKKVYERTGLAFSDDDIIEEVFVTKMGLEAFAGIDKVIDLNEIVSHDKTVGDLSTSALIRKSNFTTTMTGLEYTGGFVDTEKVIKRFGKVHENIKATHFVIDDSPTNKIDLGPDIGRGKRFAVTKRITTDDVDILVGEYKINKDKTKSKSYIVLSTNGELDDDYIKNIVDNNEGKPILNRKGEPISTNVSFTYGYFNGKKAIFENPSFEGDSFNPNIFNKNKDIYFINELDAVNHKDKLNSAIDLVTIPKHNKHFSSLFRPDSTFEGSIVVGPYADLNFIEMTEAQRNENLREAVRAYEYFLLNGVDNYLIEKYAISPSDVERLKAQYEYIKSKIGTHVLDNSILESNLNKTAGISFAEILFDFNKQFLDNQSTNLEGISRKRTESKISFAHNGKSVEIDFNIGTEQTEALRRSIDHATKPTDQSSFTIQGSAGTGKTTIVRFLHRYLKKNNKDVEITYAAPTHSANVTLVSSLMAEGVTEYPNTVHSLLKKKYIKNGMTYNLATKTRKKGLMVVDEASMLDEDTVFWLKFNYGGFTRDEVEAMSDEYKQYFFLDEYQVDELRALRGKNFNLVHEVIDGEKKVYVDTFNDSKIIFLGDPAQIPPITRDGNIMKITDVFNTENKTVLNRVYRTGSNDLLKVNNMIRKNKKLKTYYIKGSDDSIKYRDNEALFFSEFMEQYEKNPTGTVYIAYTNDDVSEFNMKAKKYLHDDPYVRVGDTVIGYSGTGGKSVNKTYVNDGISIANSIAYEIKGATKSSAYIDGVRFTTTFIDAHAPSLKKIADGGVKNINVDVASHILPLNTDSAMLSEGITEANIQENRDNLSFVIKKIVGEYLYKGQEDNDKIPNKIREAFRGVDIDRDISIDSYTGEVFFMSKEKVLNSGAKVKGDLIEIKKGIDYSYAVTVHKAQGKSIAHPFIDIKKIVSGREADILNNNKEVIGSFLNSINYVTMSRASEDITILGRIEDFTDVIDATELSLNIEAEKKTRAEAADSIQKFTYDFLTSAIGNVEMSPAFKNLGVKFSMLDLIKTAANNGTKGGSIFDASKVSDALEHIKNFTIRKASLTEVATGLINRGMITKTPDGYLILKDAEGNYLDENGNLSGKPTKIKELKGLDTYKSISKYLDKYKDYATVMFDVGATPLDVVGKVNNISASITKESEKSRYKINGVTVKGVTSLIRDEFKSPFDIKQAVIKSVFYTTVKNYKEHNIKHNGMTADEAENAAIAEVEQAMREGKLDDAKKALAKIYEFKRLEGTFAHNIIELFTMALNYSQTIDYGKDKKHGYTYYLEHIKNAILSDDKAAMNTFFDTYFFNYLKGEETTAEFKQFKAVYEKVFNTTTTGDIASMALLLEHTQKFFANDVYGKMKGPITLMPEVVIGDETMGVVGIIDLLVIDGNGDAHIFDYKTKEEGKFDNWGYSKGGVKLRGAMGSYSDNAKNHAGIQASLYKLILKKAGINVKSMKVVYIEANIKGKPDSIFEEKNSMRYDVKKMFVTPIHDFTADLLKYFKEKGIDQEDLNINNDASDVSKMVRTISGGFNIDTPRNLDATAEYIYDKAVGNKKYASEAEKAVMRLLASARTSSNEGLAVKLPGNISYTVPPEFKSKQEIIDHLKEVLTERKDVAFVEADLEAVFNSSDRLRSDTRPILGSIDKENAMRRLLYGTDPETYEFVKFSSNVDYGADFNGISMLKNKITGEVRIISLNYDNENFIPFADGHYNILGKYLSNKELVAKYPHLKGWNNSNYNMRILKIGLMAIRAKQLDPNFVVSSVLMNRDFNKGNSLPIKHDMVQILALTKAALTEAKLAGEEIPAIYEDALENPEIFNPDNYVPNSLLALNNYIETLLTTKNVFWETYKSKKGKERIKYLKSILDDFDETVHFEELLQALIEVQHSLESVYDSKEKRQNSDFWRVLDESILFLTKINYTISPTNATQQQKFFFTPSSVSNTYMSTFNRKIAEATMGLRSEFIDYKNEFNYLIDKYLEKKGINMDKLGPNLYKHSRKEALKDLFVDPNNKDRETAFLLKSPSQIPSQEGKNLVRFINKTMQEYGSRSVGRKIVIKDGWLPLIKKSRLSKKSDNNMLQNAKLSLQVTFNDRSFNENVNKSTNLESEFHINNIFDGQMPGKKDSANDQFTQARRKIIGLDSFGNEVEGHEDVFDQIEDNIENMLDSFMVASLNVIHYKGATALGRAMFYTISREAELTGQNYDTLLDVMTIIQKKNIKNKESDEKLPGLAAFNKLATTAVIAGSISQILLEAFTNPLITADNYLSDKLYSTLFGGQREFSLKSYTEATRIIMNPMNTREKQIAEAIDLKYGFSNSDSKEMQRVMKMLEGNSIFQSNNLMYLNKLFLESWQKITMVAYMIEQGSFYAHTIDRKGNLIYDESKDKRYYGDGDKEYKKKFYDSMKKKMATEFGGLTGDNTMPYEDRKINKAYTGYDMNYLKEKLVELYSSLDNSSKSMSIYYTWMSFMTKMRTYLFAKMGRYFRKPSTAEENTSMSRLQKVIDKDAPGGYRLEWKGTAAEGIVYSVIGLGRLAMEYKFDMFKNGTVTEVQKKNVSKLMADMIIGLVLSAAATGMFKAMDKEDQKDPLKKLIYKRFVMATGDAFLIKSLYDTATGNGSMFIGLSIVTRAFQNGLKAVYMSGAAGFSDEIGLEDVIQSYRHAATGFYGPLKSLDLIYSTFIENK